MLYAETFFVPVYAPDLALAIARVTIGVFFAISGFHKLYHPERHATLRKTLEDLNIPFVRFNEWFVPSVEFAAGVAITVGFFSVVAASALAVICLVAACTDGLKRVRDWKPINKADFVDSVLYLPEVVYGILIFVVILAGPDSYTLDKVILRVLLS